MTKLTDTQAILLAAAAQHDSGSLLPLPASITAPAGGVAKSLASLIKRGLAEEREVTAAKLVHHSEGDHRYGLFITAAGKTALGIEDAPIAAPAPAPAVEPTVLKGSRKRKTADATPPIVAASPETPRKTKAALVLSMLQREGGATLAELIAATGWLPHTTRAALTGVRKQGYTLAKRQRDGVTSWTVA